MLSSMEGKSQRELCESDSAKAGGLPTHLRMNFVSVTAFARPALVMCFHLRQSRLLEAVQPVDVG